MEPKDIATIIISSASFVVAGASLVAAGITLYQTQFRKPKLNVEFGSGVKVNHPAAFGFQLMIPVTISNDSTQPGLAYKIGVAIRLEHWEAQYRYLEWEAFVSYQADRNIWDLQEIAHPLVVAGKSSVSTAIAFNWSKDRERYMTEEGKYQLLTLCWTSAGQRRPAIVARRSLVVTPQLKQSIDARIGGKPPAGFPELPPGRSYNTDLVFVGQKLPNDELTEVDVDEWIGRGSVGSVG